MTIFTLEEATADAIKGVNGYHEIACVNKVEGGYGVAFGKECVAYQQKRQPNTVVSIHYRTPVENICSHCGGGLGDGRIITISGCIGQEQCDTYTSL